MPRSPSLRGPLPRPGLARSLGLSLALSLGLGVAPLLPAATPEEVDAALDEIERENYQWELPEPVDSSFDLPSLDLPLGRILGALVLVLAVVILITLLTRHLRERGTPETREEAIDGTDEPEDSSVELSDRPLVAARAAAEEGRFADAIHLLLLGTIGEIRASLGYEAPPWLTSRQILRRAPLPDAGRDALAGIVAAVERSHFGGRPADEEDFRRCVAWHRELRNACGGRRRR